MSGTQQNAGLIDAPVAEAGRIETLDVLRGFALLGILLLNILRRNIGMIFAIHRGVASTTANATTRPEGGYPPRNGRDSPHLQVNALETPEPHYLLRWRLGGSQGQPRQRRREEPY